MSPAELLALDRQQVHGAAGLLAGARRRSALLDGLPVPSPLQPVVEVEFAFTLRADLPRTG